MAQQKQILTPLICIGRKRGTVTNTERLYCFYIYFFPMFSVVAIPDDNMSKSDNSGTCLVHMLNDLVSVSRAAGFAHQKRSEDREGSLWRRNMGGTGARAAFRV